MPNKPKNKSFNTEMDVSPAEPTSFIPVKTLEGY